MKVFFENTLAGNCSAAILAKYLKTKNSDIFFPLEKDFLAPKYPAEGIQPNETVYMIGHNLSNEKMYNYITELGRNNCFVVLFNVGEEGVLQEVSEEFSQNVCYYGVLNDGVHGENATLPRLVWKYCDCFSCEVTDVNLPYFIFYLDKQDCNVGGEHFTNKDKPAFLVGLTSVNYQYNSNIWRDLIDDTMFFRNDPNSWPNAHLQLIELGETIMKNREINYFEYRDSK